MALSPATTQVGQFVSIPVAMPPVKFLLEPATHYIYARQHRVATGQAQDELDLNITYHPDLPTDRTVYVTNLPVDANAATLTSLFAEWGEVTAVHFAPRLDENPLQTVHPILLSETWDDPFLRALRAKTKDPAAIARFWVLQEPPADPNPVGSWLVSGGSAKLVFAESTSVQSLMNSPWATLASSTSENNNTQRRWLSSAMVHDAAETAEEHLEACDEDLELPEFVAAMVRPLPRHLKDPKVLTKLFTPKLTEYLRDAQRRACPPPLPYSGSQRYNLSYDKQRVTARAAEEELEYWLLRNDWVIRTRSGAKSSAEAVDKDGFIAVGKKGRQANGPAHSVNVINYADAQKMKPKDTGFGDFYRFQQREAKLQGGCGGDFFFGFTTGTGAPSGVH
ncbi:hypothetical protein IWQ60_010769 [Tieghemiomyces parasiticus]|uniref:RRM domain-containing protein n=1 Tax=Tieghemiomyces parasiticus TaxID=78921 RepID=A0A9W7ZIW3_9FUNG|nr:hypothetical protein IWQ60_010769 [Tieghemiomyces parasiticus]